MLLLLLVGARAAVKVECGAERAAGSALETCAVLYCRRCYRLKSIRVESHTQTHCGKSAAARRKAGQCYILTQQLNAEMQPDCDRARGWAGGGRLGVASGGTARGLNGHAAQFLPPQARAARGCISPVQRRRLENDVSSERLNGARRNADVAIVAAETRPWSVLQQQAI